MSGFGTPNVSETPNYSPIATELMTVAFQKMNIINEVETPTPGQFKTAFRALNSMMKELEATGIHVWTEEEGILFLQPGQARYLLGGTSTPDHATDAFDYVLTTLAADASAGAGAVTVTDATGIDDGDSFGVLLDNGFTFWTTVNGAPAGDVVTLTAPLPSASSTNNWVYAYTTPLLRPLRIPFSRRLAFNVAGQQLTPIRMLSRQEYFNLPNPLSAGTPTQVYYNPSRDQGQFFVWPVTNAGSLQNSNAMRFTYYRPINGFLSPNNTADLPDEWTNALQWNLAKEMLTDFSVPTERRAEIKMEAAAKLELVMGWDREPEDIFFGVDMSEAVRR
jgi:hypothetical protein